MIPVNELVRGYRLYEEEYNEKGSYIIKKAHT